MLHKFFEPGDWFAPKRFGYGAGWPIAWQGWVLLALFVAIVLCCTLLLKTGEITYFIIGAAGILTATGIFLLIAKRRTRGGWRMRHGEKD